MSWFSRQPSAKQASSAWPVYRQICDSRMGALSVAWKHRGFHLLIITPLFIFFALRIAHPSDLYKSIFWEKAECQIEGIEVSRVDDERSSIDANIRVIGDESRLRRSRIVETVRNEGLHIYQSLFAPTTVHRCHVEQISKAVIVPAGAEATSMSVWLLALVLIALGFVTAWSRDSGSGAVWRGMLDNNLPVLYPHSLGWRYFYLCSRLIFFGVIFVSYQLAPTLDGIPTKSELLTNWEQRQCQVQEVSTMDEKTISGMVVAYNLNGREYRFWPNLNMDLRKLTIEIPKVGEEIYCWIRKDEPDRAIIGPVTRMENADLRKMVIETLIVLTILLSFVCYLHARAEKAKGPLPLSGSFDIENRKMRQWFNRKRFEKYAGNPQRRTRLKTNWGDLFFYWGILCITGVIMARFTGKFTLPQFLACLFVGLLIIAIAASKERRSLDDIVMTGFDGMAKDDAELKLSPLSHNFEVSRNSNLSWNHPEPPADVETLRFVIKGKERCIKSPKEGFAPGKETYHLATKAKGGVDKLRKLLKIQEHEFISQEIFCLNRADNLGHAEFDLSIPAGLPHSLATPYFSVVWAIDVYAVIAGEEVPYTTFDIEVLPPGVTI